MSVIGSTTVTQQELLWEIKVMAASKPAHF